MSVLGAQYYARQQGPTESVDAYAQELKELYYKAFPDNAASGSVEAKAHLTSKFLSGLTPQLQGKLAGAEGTFDQLLSRARFEEARCRDLKGGEDNKAKEPSRLGSRERRGQIKKEDKGSGGSKNPNKECYNCGALGHIARNCPMRGRAQPKESMGKYNSKPISPLDKKLGDTSTTLKTLTASVNQVSYSCGPRVEKEVVLEGHRTQALIDTGSPVTIVDLKHWLQLWKNNRANSDPEWLKKAREAIREPELQVRAYGEAEIEILGSTEVSLRLGESELKITILLQEKAPQDLLIGTDVLSRLKCKLTVAGEVLELSDRETEPPTQPVVRLVKTVRIPARHAAAVEAYCEEAKGTLMLEDDPEMKLSVNVEPTLVEPSKQGRFPILLTNPTLETVRLEAGQMVAQAIGEFDQVDARDLQTAQVNALSVDPALPAGNKERDIELLKVLGVDSTKLALDEKDQLTRLILAYRDVFALDGEPLGATAVVEHTIDTQHATPIKQYARRIPHAMKHKVQTLVAEMLDRGIIEPTRSPWASPIVLVAKKDGTTRFCVDYRHLNCVTKQDVFPLPRVDDCLDVLAGSQYFSTLDLNSGFWQVRMGVESAEKTAFVTHCGTYEFKVMPFGLVNAPSTFQRLMETVMTGLTPRKCLVYIDDLLVMGRTFPEHLANLQEVLQRLREADLKLKPTKCKLTREEVTYLGYRVTRDGVTADPAKVEAVRSFPVPTNAKKVRSFLGLASYYRRFVPSFARIARPLHHLTKKDAEFVWTGECEEAFQRLKQLLITAPVLAYPDFTKPFKLETDASAEGLGAVLGQEIEGGSTKPIAFASRSLQGAEQRYPITELEALAVVWAVGQFRHYLYGHKCEVITDHQPLRSLLNTPHPSGKLARWGLALQELDLVIQYRPGRQNSVADALSRAPKDSGLVSTGKEIMSNTICALGTQSRRPSGGDASTTDVPPEQDTQLIGSLPPERCEGRALGGTDGRPTGSAQAWVPGDEDAELVNEQKKDPEVSDIIEYLTHKHLPEDAKQARRVVTESEMFELVQGALYRIQPDKTLRLYVPENRRKTLFDEVHSGTFSAHQKTAKIHSILSKHYWWPRMRRDIEQWCRTCTVCLERRAGPPTVPPLTSIPVEGPFDCIGMDILQMPESGRRHKYVLVFIDHLTKWAEVYPTRDQTALTVARTLVEKFVPVHGVPRKLLSDRGANFLSKLMEEVYRLLGTKKISTTAYHPQTDGTTERFHRTLLDMLAKSAKNNHNWDLHLPYVLFSYRAAEHESTRASPFKLLYGRDPTLPTMLNEPRAVPEQHTSEGYMAEIEQRMRAAWDDAQKAVQKAQQHQKIQHDKRATAVPFKEGDRVYVFMPRKLTGKTRKLERPFEGPYRVVKDHSTHAEVQREGARGRRMRVAWNRLRPCPSLEERPMNGGRRVACEGDTPKELRWTNRLRPRVRKLTVSTRTSNLARGRCNRLASETLIDPIKRTWSSCTAHKRTADGSSCNPPLVTAQKQEEPISPQHVTVSNATVAMEKGTL